MIPVLLKKCHKAPVLSMKYLNDTLKKYINDTLPLTGCGLMMPEIIVVSLRSQNLARFPKRDFYLYKVSLMKS